MNNMDHGNPPLAEQDLLRLSADIVAAYVGQNEIAAGEIAGLIGTVHGALTGLGSEPEPEAAAPAARPKPAVPVSRSIQDEYLVCLEDGKQLKMLKRYLRSRYDMSPEDYRRRWNLPADYPMIAPAYSKRRSDFAKQIGLGASRKRK